MNKKRQLPGLDQTLVSLENVLERYGTQRLSVLIGKTEDGQMKQGTWPGDPRQLTNTPFSECWLKPTWFQNNCYREAIYAAATLWFPPHTHTQQLSAQLLAAVQVFVYSHDKETQVGQRDKTRSGLEVCTGLASTHARLSVTQNSQEGPESMTYLPAHT